MIGLAADFRMKDLRNLLLAGCGVALLGLGGCAETQLAAHAAKNVGDSPNAGEQPLSGVPGQGNYKVGDPYQIAGVWYYPKEEWDYDETGIASWYGPGFHAKLTANGEIFDQMDLTAAHRTLPMPSFVRVTNLDNGRTLVLRVNDRGPYARGRILDVSQKAGQLLGFDGKGTAKVRVQIMAEESRQLAAAMKSQARPTIVASATPGMANGSVGPLQPPPYSPRGVATATGEKAPASAPRATVQSQALAPPVPPVPQPPPPPLMASPGVTPQPSVPPGPTAAAVPPGVPNPTGQRGQTAPRKTAIYVQAGAFANADNARRLSAHLTQYGPSKVVPVTIGTQQLFRVRIGPLASVEEGDRTLDKVVAAGYPESKVIVD